MGRLRKRVVVDKEHLNGGTCSAQDESEYTKMIDVVKSASSKQVSARLSLVRLPTENSDRYTGAVRNAIRDSNINGPQKTALRSALSDVEQMIACYTVQKDGYVKESEEFGDKIFQILYTMYSKKSTIQEMWQ